MPLQIPQTVVSALAVLTLAPTVQGSQGLIGYGIRMYEPECAFSCRSSIADAMLVCSDPHHKKGSGHHAPGKTSPDCYANDWAFLSTLAYCMASHCEHSVPVYKMEKYWHDKVADKPGVTPKWTYAETLHHMQGAEPTGDYDGKYLNQTMRVSHKSWARRMTAHKNFETSERTHSTLGIILLSTSVATPILWTVLTRPSVVRDRILPRLNPQFAWPSTIGTYHVRRLPFYAGNAPTRGQALYIALFIAVNILATAVGYRTTQPNAWYETPWTEVMSYLGARTGVNAFALAPLVLLFAGRNNFLLWLTDWKPGTFLLLHRWVARVFTLHIVLHTFIELAYTLRVGEGARQKETWWVWGSIATAAACIMTVASSALWVRVHCYELFLVGHIALAILVVVGSWYHVDLLYEGKWGYQLWLYMCFAVWIFDHIVRLARIVVAGGCHCARVTEITPEIVRIDVPDVRWAAMDPGTMAYAYFPSLVSWRLWENHPFSMIPTGLLAHGCNGIAAARATVVEDVEKAAALTRREDDDSATLLQPTQASSTTAGTAVSRANTKGTATAKTPTPSMSGVTFYVRKATGATRLLKNSSGATFFPVGRPPATHRQTFPVMLEGPYRTCRPKGVLMADRLVLVAGGIGITALAPFACRHANVRFCWSVRESCAPLVTEFDKFLNAPGVVDRTIVVGGRIDAAATLAEESKMGWGEIAVVVCGPGGLCDEVRAEVCRLARLDACTKWELEVEAFSW